MATKSKAVLNIPGENAHGNVSHSRVSQRVVNPETSPLEWYRLTESSRSLLNSVIAATAREKIKLKRNASPDEERLQYLDALNKEAYNLTRNGENFESATKMKKMIKKYKTILHALQPVIA
jgi:hypothetical protein